MNIINGKDVILYFTYNGLDQVICCAQSCTLNTNANIGETSTLNSGKWKTFIGVNLEWDGVCEGLCSLDANISISQIRQVQFSLQPIAIKFVSTDMNGLTEIFSSTCIITKVTNGGTAGTPSDYSVEIKGIGDIGSEVSVTVPPGCEVLWYYYDGVGGEFSTGAIATLAGHDIDGFLFRDGIQYRPSGALHDGSGTPVGKEFSYNKTTGAIGFDTTGPALEIGEHLDIPYLVCTETGGGGGGCVGVVIGHAALPDAIVGILYSEIIPFTGTTPAGIAPGAIKPSWVTLSVDNTSSVVRVIGTPTVAATNLQVAFTLMNCDDASSDSFSDSFDANNPAAETATLTFAYVKAINSFTVQLSRPINADLHITKVFADGFDNIACSIPAVASAQFNGLSSFDILSGGTGNAKVAESQSGDWSTAIRFDIYNVVINGSSFVNGDVLSIGSYLITMVIPSCA